jgi:WD40 repeat protein
LWNKLKNWKKFFKIQKPSQNAACLLVIRVGAPIDEDILQNIYSTAFLPYGKILATGSEECTIKIWRTAD